MAGFLSSGASWLADALQTASSTTVTLRRGSDSTSGVHATSGRSVADVANVDGSFATKESRDFKIKAADYKIGGVITKPKSGDLIAESDGEKVHLYEVLPFAGQECFAWSDVSRFMLRVHTRFIGSVDLEGDDLERSISGVLPRPDGQTDAADRRHASGNVRVFE